MGDYISRAFKTRPGTVGTFFMFIKKRQAQQKAAGF